jgi:hypothetical protein
LIPDAEPIPVPPASQTGRPPQLVTVVAEDGWNLQWPRPVVSWRQLYGVDGPAARPPLSDDAIRAERLTPGEPFGLLGSSSLLWGDTAASHGRYWEDRDPFNTGDEAPFRWVRQGGDAGVYRDDDVWAVRILLQLPSTDRTYPNNGRKLYVTGGERMRILGEIPVRKPGAPCGIELLVLTPVLDFQSVNPAELSLVVGDQDESQRQRVGRNHHVVGTNG